MIPFKILAQELPIKGSATLTDAQAADLEAGKYYVNVHTAANKDGEIRGQIDNSDVEQGRIRRKKGQSDRPFLYVQAFSRILVSVGSA